MRFIITILILLLSYSIYSQHNCLDFLKEKIQLTHNKDINIDLINSKEFDFLIVGERHFIEQNPTIHFELLKKLNLENNWNWLLIEYPPSMSFFIQQYLNSGNNEYLNIAFENVPFSGHRKKIFMKILDFNKNTENKIKVLGIDLEVGGYKRLLKIIENIRKQFNSDKELKIIDHFLNTFNEHKPGKNSKIAFKEFSALINTNQYKLKKHFIELYPHLKLIMDNLQNKFIESEEEMFDEKFQILRDSFMYLNITQLSQLVNLKKCYIQIGFFHAEKVNDSIHRRLANYLENWTYSSSKPRVKTARINYLNFNYDANGYELRFKELLDISNLNKDDIQSIFNQSNKNVGIVKINEDLYKCVEKKNFDYLIYMYNDVN